MVSAVNRPVKMAEVPAARTNCPNMADLIQAIPAEKLGHFLGYSQGTWGALKINEARSDIRL